MFARSSLKAPWHPMLRPSRLLIPSFSSVLRGIAAKATTTKQPESEAYGILVRQRKNRPLAPHLSIYQPQLTWYMSGANRITGVTLGGLYYLFFLSYAAAPITGMLPASAAIAATFTAMPLLMKLPVKLALVVSFMFHNFNGVRHLLWDQAKALDLKNVYRTGYGVLAMTAVASVHYMMV